MYVIRELQGKEKGVQEDRAIDFETTLMYASTFPRVPKRATSAKRLGRTYIF